MTTATIPTGFATTYFGSPFGIGSMSGNGAGQVSTTHHVGHGTFQPTVSPFGPVFGWPLPFGQFSPWPVAVNPFFGSIGTFAPQSMGSPLPLGWQSPAAYGCTWPTFGTTTFPQPVLSPTTGPVIPTPLFNTGTSVHPFFSGFGPGLIGGWNPGTIGQWSQPFGTWPFFSTPLVNALTGWPIGIVSPVATQTPNCGFGTVVPAIPFPVGYATPGQPIQGQGLGLNREAA